MKIQTRDFKTTYETWDEGVFEGYFIRYNSPAPYLGSDWREQIDPDAINLNGDTLCLYNHNHDLILGRESAGTLEVEKRPDGLFGRCILNLEDSDARNVYARVKRGDIKGCSFGFTINDQDVDTENKLITLRDLDVFEISVCPMPFYRDTSVSARNICDSLKSEFLRRRLEWRLKR